VLGGSVSYDEGMTWETIISNHLSVPAGKGDAIIRITSIDNLIHEANKSLILTASTIASSAAAIGTITDNDPLSYITGVTSSTAVEGSANVFSVSLSPQTAIRTNVDLSISSVTAIAGSDYSTTFEISLDSGINWVSLSGNSALIPIGVASLQVRHSTINDLIHELTETYELTASCNGLSVSAIGTITDNDPLSYITGVTSSTAVEGSANVFTVSLSPQTAIPTTVDLSLAAVTAIAGSDYSTTFEISLDSGINWLSLSGNSALIPIGLASLQVRHSTINDLIHELTETYELTASCNGSSVSAIGTITDNDAIPVPLAMAGVSVTEGGIAIFNLALQGSNSLDTPISFTITAGTATASDYANVETSLNGVSNWLPLVANLATLPPGYSSIYARVQTVDDTVVESTEQFTLTASCGGASITATATIIDNDVAPVPLNVVTPGTTGKDTINGGTGNDLIQGGGGIDLLRGFDGSDVIYAGSQANPNSAGNSNMYGDAGNDTLYGGSTGLNKLNGTNDTLLGVGEQDVLYGGSTTGSTSSVDTFVLGNINSCYYLGTNDYAIINNFDPLKDKIQLSGALATFSTRYSINNSVAGVSSISYIDPITSVPNLIAKVNSATPLIITGSYFIQAPATIIL
jgi:Ca2+-binding RTX toxin-like protein